MSGAQISTLRKVLSRRATTQKIPLKSMIVLTERCHLKCQQCYLVENPREELSTEKIKDVIDQLAKSGALWLTFTGGEPLLRSDIIELLTYAKTKGFVITIFTSGTPCANPDRVKRLKEAGLHKASISFYAADPKKHDTVTLLPGSHAQTVEGIKNLRAAGIQVELKYLQMSLNRDEFMATKALAQELDASFRYSFNVTACHDGRRDPMELQVKEEELVSIYHQIADRAPKDPHIGRSVNKPDVNALACSAGHSRVSIGVDGKVYGCVDLNLPVGNIKEQSLQEIWQGDKIKEIRNLKNFSHPACMVCPDQSFCARCPGSAVLDSGDPGKPAFNTCMLARVQRRVYEERNGIRPMTTVENPMPEEQLDMIAAPLSSSCGGCSSSSNAQTSPVEEVKKFLLKR